ncbi:MAG: hypothetical protein R3B40_03445 [Polyangiales bacterium]
MVHHPDLRTNARVRAARDVVRAAFKEHAALFAGERPCRPNGGTSGPEIAPGTPTAAPVS